MGDVPICTKLRGLRGDYRLACTQEAAEMIEMLVEALEYVWTHVELEGEVGAIVAAARKKARGRQ